MYDSTFYSKKYKCPLMSLFYLEIIDHTLLFLFIKKYMLYSSLAYMQLNEKSPTDLSLICYKNKKGLLGHCRAKKGHHRILRQKLKKRYLILSL
jgi:hypothetical protein